MSRGCTSTTWLEGCGRASMSGVEALEFEVEGVGEAIDVRLERFP